MKTLEDWPALSPDDRTRLGLSRRPPKPEATVSAKHGEVLDMWHDDNPFGPQDIPASSPVKVKWVCGTGHQFVESAVVQCGAVSGWRAEAGGSRACKHCHEDQRTDRTRLECGHSVTVRPGDEDRTLCWNCKQDWYDENEASILSTRDALLPDARELVERLMEVEQVPQLFRSLIQGKLAHIIAFRTAFAAIEGKEPPAVGDIPDAMRLLRRPSAADIGRSVAHAEPVEMFGVQFWAEGFGLPTGIAENYGLGVPFARTIAAEIHALLPVPAGVETATATRVLTEQIKTVLYTNRFMEKIRVTVAKELRLPVPATGGDVRPGRIDITAMYGLIPSIVIELDSTNKASSLDKLEYARDHGAYPIWVRWNASAVAPVSRAGIVTITPAGVHGSFLREEAFDISDATERSK